MKTSKMVLVWAWLVVTVAHAVAQQWHSALLCGVIAMESWDNYKLRYSL